MPQEQQNGRATLFGIRSDGTPIAISGYVSIILETGKGQHKFKMDSIEDELGFDASLIATNGHVELDLAWTPTGATRADAEASAVFLEPLAKVTISNVAVAFVNGDWVYVGDQSIDLSHKQGKMTLKVRKYDDADQNTSLTTNVTG